jgi:hypothetical protein
MSGSVALRIRAHSMTALRLAYTFLRVCCMECGHLIWPWQARHRYGHRDCTHRARLALWQRGRDVYGYSVPFGPCVDCGAGL